MTRRISTQQHWFGAFLLGTLIRILAVDQASFRPLRAHDPFLIS
jgi:hypothetical protein